MLVNYNLLHHFRNLWPTLREFNLRCEMDVHNFALTITWRGKELVLQGQFSSMETGVLTYGPYVGMDVRHFIGWRPYAGKTWPLARDKIPFKEFLKEHGIRTPAYSRHPSADMSDVVVKRIRSSFGQNMHGPFKKSSMYNLNALEGEFYEQYIDGTIVKIWYWNDLPVAAEAIDQFYVIGDGRSTIWELIEAYVKSIERSAPDPDYYTEFLAYRGLTLKSVPKRDERCPIDYRYNSGFPNQGRDVRIGKDPFFNLEAELAAMGLIFWKGIPEDIRQDTVYGVDGVVDRNGKLWILEMNSNPVVHPYVYPAMIRSWLDRVRTERPQPPRQPVPRKVLLGAVHLP